MVSMIPLGGSRPSIPAYPAIADAIRGALDGVYYHNEDPKVGLDKAAEISAEKLGWP